MILSYSFRLQHRLLRVVEPVGPDGNGENLILPKYHRASLNFFSKNLTCDLYMYIDAFETIE